MPKCPNCGLEIHELKIRSIDDYGRLLFTEDGELGYQWASDDFGEEVACLEFSCPECKHVLFTDPINAKDFLTEGAKDG